MHLSDRRYYKSAKLRPFHVPALCLAGELLLPFWNRCYADLILPCLGICCTHSCFSSGPPADVILAPHPHSFACAEPGSASILLPAGEQRGRSAPLSPEQLWKGWWVCREFTWPSGWWGLQGRRRFDRASPMVKNTQGCHAPPDPRSSSWDRALDTMAQMLNQGWGRDDMMGLRSHSWTVKGHEPGEGCWKYSLTSLSLPPEEKRTPACKMVYLGFEVTPCWTVLHFATCFFCLAHCHCDPQFLPPGSSACPPSPCTPKLHFYSSGYIYV